MKTFRKYPYTAPSAEVFEIDGALPLCQSPDLQFNGFNQEEEW